MKEKVYYVIQLKNNLFFKIDNASGGYPTMVDDFEYCEKYDTKEFTEKFLHSNYATKMFRDFFIDAKIKKVIMTLQ